MTLGPAGIRCARCRPDRLCQYHLALAAEKQRGQGSTANPSALLQSAPEPELELVWADSAASGGPGVDNTYDYRRARYRRVPRRIKI